MHKFSTHLSSSQDSDDPVVGMDFVALDLCLVGRRLHSIDWTFGVSIDLVRHMDSNHSVWNHMWMNVNVLRRVNRHQHSLADVNVISVHWKVNC